MKEKNREEMTLRKNAGHRGIAGAASLLAVLVLCLALVACGGQGGDSDKDGGDKRPDDAGKGSGIETLATYEEGKEPGLPTLVVKEDDTYYFLLQPYGADEYSFAVGEDPAKPEVVYSGSHSFDTQNLSVMDGSAAWMETSKDDAGTETVVVRYYDGAADASKDGAADSSVREVWRKEIGSDGVDYINPKVFLYEDRIYLMQADLDENIMDIIAVDIATGEETNVYTKSLFLERFGGAFQCEDHTLFFEDPEGDGDKYLVAMDLRDNDIRRIPVPEGVENIYAVDYEDGVYALYYYDSTEGDNAWNGAENIGWYKEGDDTIDAVFSFPKESDGTYVAYQNNLELEDGKLHWIYQQNISGDIIDHYHLAWYDIATNEPKEYYYTFGFFVDGDELYTLSWDDKENTVNRVYLKEINE